MDGYSFFRIYQPLNLHFTSSYDIFKYAGKSPSISPDVFNGRKDRGIFERYGGKFSSKSKAGQFCLANFIYNESKFIYSDYNDAEEVYVRWKSINDSLNYRIENDLNVLSQALCEKKVASIRSLFTKTPKGNTAPILQLVSAGQVSKEYLCIMDHYVLPVVSRWKEEYSSDPLISSELNKIEKYAPFVYNKVDVTKVKTLFKEFAVKNG